MSYPVEDNGHVAEAKALLTDHYRNKTIIPALVAAFAKSDQGIEDMLWGVIEAGFLSTPATGDALTRLADITGLERNTYNDLELYYETLLQIRTNRSQGLFLDIVDIATLASVGASGPHCVEIPVASFLVEVWDVPTALITAPNSFTYYLDRGKSVGTRGLFSYSTWTDGGDLEWSSVSAPSVGQQGWSSVSATSDGGYLVACKDTSP